MRPLTNKVDLQDTVMADHVNALQEEVRAIELTMGTPTATGTQVAAPSVLVSPWSTGFQQRSTAWNSVSDRLVNIEAGLLYGVPGAPYVRKSGGDTILPTSGTVGLAMRTQAGTANLFESRSAANTLNFRLDKDGLPFVGNNAVLYVNSSDYNYILSQIQAVSTALNQTVHPLLVSGI